MLNNLIQILTVTFFVMSCARETRKISAPPGAQGYIVVMKKSAVVDQFSATGIKASTEDAVEVLAAELSSKHELADANYVYSHALTGALYQMSEEQAEKVKEDAMVAFVEKDQIISINQVAAPPQENATWGLDRLDQADLPLSSTYQAAAGEGKGVNVYIIDTGILNAHAEFQGRAVSGFDFIDNDVDATDCNGHGTHVAGTVGGKTYGVAKKVKLHGVRVLDCFGSGKMSGVLAGVDWVTQNHTKPAVANMSLGGGASLALDQAVEASIKAGVIYAVAAGNSNTDACSASPARVKDAITVGATTRNDQRSSFSNFGSCVDIFAPGTDITSAWHSSNAATNTISGTSMASPHVAGVAALYLGLNPSDSPSAVLTALVKSSAVGKINDTKSGSPNLLLSSKVNGPPPIPQPGNSIKNGVPLTQIGAAKNAELKYQIQIPTGATQLTVEIFGGSGDADLYVRRGLAATLSSYNCRPYKSFNMETCSIANPSEGPWHIMIKGYQSFSGLNLKVSWK